MQKALTNMSLLIYAIILLLLIYFFARTNSLSLPQSQENFVDNYYSLNWTSPDLINYVNSQKVCMNHRQCMLDKQYLSENRDMNNSFSRANCTYSMSCDYTDDSAHPQCYKGYDSPGYQENLSTVASRDLLRTHTI